MNSILLRDIPLFGVLMFGGEENCLTSCSKVSLRCSAGLTSEDTEGHIIVFSTHLFSFISFKLVCESKYERI